MTGDVSILDWYHGKGGGGTAKRTQMVEHEEEKSSRFLSHWFKIMAPF